MAFDVHERGATDSDRAVHLIDLTDEEPEAPFAVREADGSLDAVPGRIPDKAEILAWLEDHPVVVGIATGVLCFSIIAGAMSAVVGSDTESDDPVAGAASSDTDGGQGSFSSSGSGGSNFTSDDSKLSRTGAGKVVDGATDDEIAAGPNADEPGDPTNPNGQSARNPESSDPSTAEPSNLDQSATIGGRPSATGNGPGQSAGPASNGTRPSATGDGPGQSAGANPNGSPTAAGNTVTTLNPGPNVGGPISTTTTTSRTTSTTRTSQTTATTTGQTSPSSSSTVPTTGGTTPTTAPTTASTTTTSTTSTTAPTPVDLSIAAPANGSSHSYETPTNFAANFVPGATQYCWAFVQGGATVQRACSASTTYQLPARPSAIAPGLVTVQVTASGPFGTVSDSIQISLYRTRVLNNPTKDLQIGKGALRVGVVNLTGATEYCFRLTQSGYNSGALCYSTPGNTFNKHDPIWDSLSPGSLTVTATIYGGGTLLATDSVTIQLLAP